MNQGFSIIKYFKNNNLKNINLENTNLENTSIFFFVIFTGIGNCDCSTYDINNNLENGFGNKLSYIKYFREISDILCININNNILIDFYEKTEIIKELIEEEYHKNSRRQIIFLTHSFGSILAINIIKLINNNLIKLIMIEPTNESSINTLTMKKGISKKGTPSKKEDTFMRENTSEKIMRENTLTMKKDISKKGTPSKKEDTFIREDTSEKKDTLTQRRGTFIVKSTPIKKEINYNKIFDYIRLLSSNTINCKVLIIISFNQYFFFNILNKINKIDKTERYSNIDKLKRFYSTQLDKINSLQKIINYRDNENIHIVTIPTEERNSHFLYKNHKKKIINYIKQFINHNSNIDLFESLDASLLR